MVHVILAVMLAIAICIAIGIIAEIKQLERESRIPKETPRYGPARSDPKDQEKIE